MSEKPYWYPVLVDDKWRAQLREDYPDKADWTDDELDEYFNEEDSKYSITWDHLGDAYNDYEALADAYLELEAKLRAVGELQKEWITESGKLCESGLEDAGAAVLGCADELEALLNA